MNAHIMPTNRITRLPPYQYNLIVKIATRKEPICVRADRLKALDYCTDDVKFEVLKKSRKVDDETYQALYDLYFGVVEKDDAKPEPAPEPKKNKGGRPSKWDDADVLTLIHYYNKGTKASVLADMFHKSENVIYNKLYRLKRDEKYKEMFTMSKEKAAPKPQEQEKKFEDIIQSVDAGSRKEPEIKDEDAKMEDLFQTVCESNKNAARAFREMAMSTEAVAKAFHFPVNNSFCAEGTGLISTDGSIKLDDEPILAALRKEMIDSGCVQCYGTVQIIITPHKPTGMKVTRGVTE